MIGDVQHQQLLIARGVLLIDLAAEADGVAGTLRQRPLQLAAQSK